MPFERIIPHSLTAPSIRTYAPHAPGIYGLSNAREWVYIGVADDIHAELLQRIAAPASPVMSRRPTGFVFEVCHPQMREARRQRLVWEYAPVYTD